MLDANAIQVRIGELCHQFRLPTMGAQSVSRFTAAGHGDALETLLEVLEQEAEDRRQRRIGRLRTASRLPAGKTWETFEHDRVPLALRQQLGELASGSFVDRGVNVLAFGLPGTGKTHALCAVGHRLVEAGRSVLFAPAYRLVQDLLAAKRDLALPRQLRKLDNYDFLLLDDLGYLPQGAEESEVLFTLIAERYERRSLGITSNLVFSQWEHIFANPMATAAAIDRVVHHSVILEFDVPSYRTGVAQQRSQEREVNRQPPPQPRFYRLCGTLLLRRLQRTSFLASTCSGVGSTRAFGFLAFGVAFRDVFTVGLFQLGGRPPVLLGSGNERVNSKVWPIARGSGVCGRRLSSMRAYGVLMLAILSSADC